MLVQKNHFLYNEFVDINDSNNDCKKINQINWSSRWCFFFDLHKYRVKKFINEQRYINWSTNFAIKKIVKIENNDWDLSTIITFDETQRYVICFENAKLHEKNVFVNLFERTTNDKTNCNHEKTIFDKYVTMKNINLMKKFRAKRANVIENEKKNKKNSLSQTTSLKKKSIFKKTTSHMITLFLK